MLKTPYLIKSYTIRLTKAVFFLIILGVLCFVGNWVCAQSSQEKYVRNIWDSFYDLPENTVDVAYIGASAAFAFWNTAEAYHTQGISTALLGGDSGTMNFLKYMMEEVRKTQNPKLFVLDMAALSANGTSSFKNNNIYYVSGNMNWSQNKWDFIESSLYYQGKTNLTIIDKLYYQFFFTFDMRKNNMASLPETIKSFFKDSLRESFLGTLVDGHIVPVKRLSDEEYNGEPVKSEFIDEILEDLLNYIEANNLNVLFIQAPRPWNAESWARSNYVEGYLTERDYTVKNMGYAYEKEIGINYDTDFYNEAHLNFLGQRKYTDYFAAWLKKTYDLPDHRGESEYIMWEEAYEDYNAYYQRLIAE